MRAGGGGRAPPCGAARARCWSLVDHRRPIRTGRSGGAPGAAADAVRFPSRRSAPCHLVPPASSRSTSRPTPGQAPTGQRSALRPLGERAHGHRGDLGSPTRRIRSSGRRPADGLASRVGPRAAEQTAVGRGGTRRAGKPARRRGKCTVGRDQGAAEVRPGTNRFGAEGGGRDYPGEVGRSVTALSSRSGGRRPAAGCRGASVVQPGSGHHGGEPRAGADPGEPRMPPGERALLGTGPRGAGSRTGRRPVEPGRTHRSTR